MLEDRLFQKFDAHVHVGVWQSPDFGGHGTTLPQTAGVLAASGVTGALVMSTDSGDNQQLVNWLRAYEGDVEFLAAAWACPDDAGIADLVSGFDYRAIKVHPSFNRRPVTDPCWIPALKAAADKNLPVVVHCGRWQEVAGYNLLIQTARKWPDVRFVMAHMGGDSPSLVMGAANDVAQSGLTNIWFGTESIREYWLLAMAVRIAGADRVLFGSDHNLNSPASFLAVIDAADLSADEKALILGGNACTLFGR